MANREINGIINISISMVSRAFDRMLSADKNKHHDLEQVISFYLCKRIVIIILLLIMSYAK